MKNYDMNEKRAQIHALRQRTILAENHRGRWSKKDLKMLRKFFDEDMDISDMAIYFQRSELAVANQIAKFFPRVRKPKQSSEGCKCPQCIHYRDCAGPCPEQNAKTK